MTPVLPFFPSDFGVGVAGFVGGTGVPVGRPAEIIAKKKNVLRKVRWKKVDKKYKSVISPTKLKQNEIYFYFVYS